MISNSKTICWHSDVSSNIFVCCEAANVWKITSYKISKVTQKYENYNNLEQP